MDLETPVPNVLSLSICGELVPGPYKYQNLRMRQSFGVEQCMQPALYIHRFQMVDWKYYFQTSVGWMCKCKNQRYEGPTVVKILILKLIYIFNAIPMKIPIEFISRFNKIILKLTWNSKEIRITKIILKILPPDFKTYYKATVLAKG